MLPNTEYRVHGGKNVYSWRCLATEWSGLAAYMSGVDNPTAILHVGVVFLAPELVPT